MPAAIFNSGSVKILKDSLKFKSGTRIFVTTVDPSAVATDGEPGDVIINTSTELLYVKKDSGATTNWDVLIDDASLSTSLASYILNSEKGAANGVATLDAGSKLTASQIPAIAITDTFVVASQAAQEALTAEVGDVAVRTDENKSYILQTEPATSFANWVELLSPTDAVLSVFSRTGIVTAQSGDYTASQVTNVPAGNLAAITVQAALDELQTDIDGAANKTLSNLDSPTSVNQSLIPAVNSTQDLGTTAKRFQDIYASTLKDASGQIVLNQQNRQLSDAAGSPALTFSSATEMNAHSRKITGLADQTGLTYAMNKQSTQNLLKNLIADGDCEGAQFFSQYNDGASSRPVDGTGGVVTTEVLSTLTSTNKLDGNFSNLLSKTAVNAQGFGWSVPFTISTANQARVMQIEFDYRVVTGPFTAGTASTDSDMIVYIYDVTNSTLIEPSSIKLLSNSATVTDKFITNFQTSATGTSYRLILHVATTVATAWSLITDNFKVAPCNYVYGTPITDWVAYTPTFTNFGTVTSINIRSRRVGDSLEVQGRFTSGVTAASEARISLGYAGANGNVTIDSSKIAVTTDVGAWSRNLADASNVSYFVLADPSNSYIRVGTQTAAAAPYAAANTNAVADTGGISGMNFTVPISGWSSSVQMSDSYDGRLIVARARHTTGQAIASGSTDIINYATVDFDSTSSITTGAAWKFTAPSSGYYRVSGAYVFSSSSWGSNTSTLIAVYKNGSEYATLGFHRTDAASGADLPAGSGSTILPLNAGDYIDFRVFQNDGTSESLNSDGRQNWVTIEKLQAPTTISATERVSFHAHTATNAVSTSSPFLYTTVIDNSHGAYSTTTGKFTAPVIGFYFFRCTGYVALVVFEPTFYLNGVSVNRGPANKDTSTPASGTFAILMNAGDTMEIRSGTSGTAAGDLTLNNFSGFLVK